METVEKEAARTTIVPVLRALEILALCVESCPQKHPSFRENHSHSLEDAGLRVAICDIE
jgi:hypothetical protein